MRTDERTSSSTSPLLRLALSSSRCTTRAGRRPSWRWTSSWTICWRSKRTMCSCWIWNTCSSTSTRSWDCSTRLSQRDAKLELPLSCASPVLSLAAMTTIPRFPSFSFRFCEKPIRVKFFLLHYAAISRLSHLGPSTTTRLCAPRPLSSLFDLTLRPHIGSRCSRSPPTSPLLRPGSLRLVSFCYHILLRQPRLGSSLTQIVLVCSRFAVAVALALRLPRSYASTKPGFSPSIIFYSFLFFGQSRPCSLGRGPQKRYEEWLSPLPHTVVVRTSYPPPLSQF